MKKPDWSNAPASASYLAKSGDGNYAWHDKMPVAVGNMRWSIADGSRAEHAGQGAYDGKMTLEKRP